MEVTIPFVIIIGFCASIFIVIGIYALKKKAPMHFWAGTTIKSEDITDIKAYNKANGIMWISYGSLLALSGIFSFVFGTAVGGILVAISCTLGLIVLIIIYGKIYDKYKR